LKNQFASRLRNVFSGDKISSAEDGDGLINCTSAKLDEYCEFIAFSDGETPF
jgi:hypothetical protein